jgi:hypothetical protein
MLAPVDAYLGKDTALTSCSDHEMRKPFIITDVIDLRVLFHDMFVYSSPDMFHDMFVYQSGLGREPGH